MRLHVVVLACSATTRRNITFLVCASSSVCPAVSAYHHHKLNQPASACYLHAPSMTSKCTQRRTWNLEVGQGILSIQVMQGPRVKGDEVYCTVALHRIFRLSISLARRQSSESGPPTAHRLSACTRYATHGGVVARRLALCTPILILTARRSCSLRLFYALLWKYDYGALARSFSVASRPQSRRSCGRLSRKNKVETRQCRHDARQSTPATAPSTLGRLQGCLAFEFWTAPRADFFFNLRTHGARAPSPGQLTFDGPHAP